MRLVLAAAVCLLAGCLDCSGTSAEWTDDAAPGFLRAHLGAPVVHPYQGDAGFGEYGIEDAYLLSVSRPSNHTIQVLPHAIGYWMRASDDREAVRAELLAVGQEVYLGELAEFERAVDASLAEVEAYMARGGDVSRDLFIQEARLEADWDLDAMWATTNGTTRSQFFAYGVVEGDWSFRYRLAEWRFSVGDLEVAYDIWGHAEAKHDEDVAEESVKARVRDWFTARGGSPTFQGFDISHIRC